MVGAGDSLDLAFTIDKGVADGVLVGNPVIDTSGNAVGTVVEVFETKAKVLPVIARTEGTGVRAGEQRGVLLGLGREDELQLEILDATAVVRSELLLLTEAGKFPPGLPVAVVMESAGPEAGQIRALAEPTADFTRLRIVVVLGWPLPEEPAAPAVTTTVPAATTTTGDQGSGG